MDKYFKKMYDFFPNGRNRIMKDLLLFSILNQKEGNAYCKKKGYKGLVQK